MVGIVSLAFGLVTPPYGLCLMISAAIGGIPIRAVLKDICLMLLPMLGVLALLIMVPDVALFLPRTLTPDYVR
jgi:TRAP-type C4-dicarboxylate transport system permease large subunit